MSSAAARAAARAAYSAARAAYSEMKTRIIRYGVELLRAKEPA